MQPSQLGLWLNGQGHLDEPEIMAVAWTEHQAMFSESDMAAIKAGRVVCYEQPLHGVQLSADAARRSGSWARDKHAPARLVAVLFKWIKPRQAV